MKIAHHTLSTGKPTVKGFTLLELVVTITVLSVLALGILPLAQSAVKRQKEAELRAALEEMRTAIRDFHRDTYGFESICAQNAPPRPGVGGPPIDPRNRVVVSQCDIFKPENQDYYPPSLETLVDGVNVKPRTAQPVGGVAGQQPTDNKLKVGDIVDKKKIYLRKIPVDPMTGESDWVLRSTYDAPDAGSWGGENVFDVRSKSDAVALNGEKYSDW